MTRLVPFLFGEVAIATVWLCFRQDRLTRQVEKLQAENTRLNQLLANKPDLTKEEFTAVSRRLENAEAFMDAVEGRLTNASMLLAQLQQASRRLTATPPPGVAVEERWSRRRPIMTESSQVADPGLVQPKTPASSHSPTGELLSRS